MMPTREISLVPEASVVFEKKATVENARQILIGLYYIVLKGLYIKLLPHHHCCEWIRALLNIAKNLCHIFAFGKFFSNGC